MADGLGCSQEQRGAVVKDKPYVPIGHAEQRIFAHGARAWHDGKKETDNPYDPKSQNGFV